MFAGAAGRAQRAALFIPSAKPHFRLTQRRVCTFATPAEQKAISNNSNESFPVLNAKRLESNCQACSPWAGLNLRPRIVTLYSYKDENGILRYQQVRFKPKDFRFRRPDGNGGWIWNLQGVSMILYRLREVIDADEVFIVEGEKDVETLRAWGSSRPATQEAQGNGAMSTRSILTRKKAIVLQDDDEPGRKHARAVAESVAECAWRLSVLCHSKTRRT